jgi:hypothetical protein
MSGQMAAPPTNQPDTVFATSVGVWLTNSQLLPCAGLSQARAGMGNRFFHSSEISTPIVLSFCLGRSRRSVKIKHIAHLNLRAGMYALFGDDGHLCLTQKDGFLVSVAHLPWISTVGLVKLYVHEPWVCVTERFGTHAALVHLENANVREMSREDYHANVSSYSIGFLERDGRVLIIHQTEWNRLDIMDAETGDCLTDREIYLRDAEPDGKGEEWILPGHEAKNYIDYFHSLLHVSPDGSYFLSNGWIWHPLGQITYFHTDDFLKCYELSKVSIEYCNDYNWDRPCAFVGDDRFVIAADDMRKDDALKEEELEGHTYKQLQFYCMNMSVREDQYEGRILAKACEAECSAFTPDEHGYVHGELIWDSAYKYLIAITPNGTFALNLDGEVLESYPECKYTEDSPLSQKQSCDLAWHYSPESHLLYHWSQEEGAVEERWFDCTGY